MDFSKVDWMHVLGWTTAAAVGVGALATLPASGPLLAIGTALGVTLTAGGAGLAAGTISAVSQAKAAAK